MFRNLSNIYWKAAVLVFINVSPLDEGSLDFTSIRKELEELQNTSSKGVPLILENNSESFGKSVEFREDEEEEEEVRHQEPFEKGERRKIKEDNQFQNLLHLHQKQTESFERLTNDFEMISKQLTETNSALTDSEMIRNQMDSEIQRLKLELKEKDEIISGLRNKLSASDYRNNKNSVSSTAFTQTLKNSTSTADDYKQKYLDVLDDYRFMEDNYSTLEEENELLKLKVLNLTPGSLAMKSKHSSESETRDLIRKHKEQKRKTNHSVFLHEDRIVASLSIEECRHLIETVCLKLDIENLHNLVQSLEDIQSCIRLVPHMKRFISDVDELCWSSTAFINGTSAPLQTHHKLSETLVVLESWSSDINQLSILKTFSRSVFNLLGLTFGSKDLSEEMKLTKCLGELKRIINSDIKSLPNNFVLNKTMM
jgi:hypothetical protein